MRRIVIALVGISCDPVACRAFVWQNGVMTSLASLATLATGDALSSAQDINNAAPVRSGRLPHHQRARALAAGVDRAGRPPVTRRAKAHSLSQSMREGIRSDQVITRVRTHR